MYPYITFGVDDHSERRRVPKFGDVMRVDARFVLSHLESSHRPGVVDCQRIGRLDVRRCNVQVSSHGQVGN